VKVLVVDTNIFTLPAKTDKEGWDDAQEFLLWISEERFCNYTLGIDEKGLILEEYEKEIPRCPGSIGEVAFRTLNDAEKLIPYEGNRYPCFKDLPPPLDKHDKAFLAVACQTSDHILISQDGGFHEDNTCLNDLKSKPGIKIYWAREAMGQI